MVFGLSYIPGCIYFSAEHIFPVSCKGSIFKTKAILYFISFVCGQDDPLNILKNSFFCCLICIYFFSFFFEHPVEDMGRKCTLEWRGIWEPLAGTINCSETFRKSQLFTLLQTQAHFMFSGSHIIQQISLFLHNNQPNTTRHLFKLILL